MALLPQAIANLVEQDGLPRVATADDESRHVLYLETDGLVHSRLTQHWGKALPEEPTEGERATGRAAREQEKDEASEQARLLRQRILQAAQGSVGESVDQLTSGEVRALLAILLYRAGAIDKDGVVRALDGWV